MVNRPQFSLTPDPSPRGRGAKEYLFRFDNFKKVVKSGVELDLTTLKKLSNLESPQHSTGLRKINTPYLFIIGINRKADSF